MENQILPNTNILKKRPKIINIVQPWFLFLEEVRHSLRKLFLVNKNKINNLEAFSIVSKDDKDSKAKKIGDCSISDDNVSLSFFDNSVLRNSKLTIPFLISSRVDFSHLHHFLERNVSGNDFLKINSKINNIYKDVILQKWAKYWSFFDCFIGIYSKNNDKNMSNSYFNDFEDLIIFHLKNTNNIIEEIIKNDSSISVINKKFFDECHELNIAFNEFEKEDKVISIKKFNNLVTDVEKQLKEIKKDNEVIRDVINKDLITWADFNEFRQEIYLLLKNIESSFDNPKTLKNTFKKIMKYLGMGILTVSPALLQIGYEETKRIDFKKDHEKFIANSKKVDLNKVYNEDEKTETAIEELKK